MLFLLAYAIIKSRQTEGRENMKIPKLEDIREQLQDFLDCSFDYKLFALMYFACVFLLTLKLCTLIW